MAAQLWLSFVVVSLIMLVVGVAAWRAVGRVGGFYALIGRSVIVGCTLAVAAMWATLILR